MSALMRDPSPRADSNPVVVVGYIKEFLSELGIRSDGRLTLFGRPVSGSVNDRFCLNLLSQFDGLVDDAESDVIRKVDRSIRLTEEYYQMAGGAFHIRFVNS